MPASPGSTRSAIPTAQTASSRSRRSRSFLRAADGAQSLSSMSRENLERSRRYYEAWNSGDMPAVMDAMAPDVEWHGHPNLPEPGPYHDRDDVERWMRQFREAWGELNAEPVELLDADDSVVALIHMTGRGRGSGVEVAGGVDAHVARFRDGDVIYFRIYPGDRAADLAGLDQTELDLLVLRVAHGMDEDEIAERTGRGPADVRAILDGTREKLRSLPSAESVS